VSAVSYCVVGLRYLILCFLLEVDAGSDFALLSMQLSSSDHGSEYGTEVISVLAIVFAIEGGE
jgi:hypothetical protein